ncbi:hypothetical protein E3T54_03460 [Cryobacterium sp. Sr8]|uniref:anti-sigma factor n=2 Tax=unclassified Cryobacterium TaxID=2649013 RepID=UPI00106CCFB0|nr:anti-sigma factor [Cryobacterium sp. Sr8]TFD80300.1 hypothetical protein E3T54_03460 [Cryobacterium sp. Sr8]
MTEQKQNPADLSGAYALNALGADDKAVYEAYLAGSDEARTEAAELGDTALALGLAADPVQPSEGLKASLMARLASTPQLPPLPVPEAAPAEQSAPEDAPAAGVTESGVGVPAAAPAEPSTRRSAAADRAQRRWFQRPAGMLVAAAAAVALFAGGTFVGQALNSNQFEQQQAAQLAEINAAPDAQRAATTTTDGQPATLVWSGELGLSALMVQDLPALSADQDYQLWYMNDAGAVPAGTFDSTGSGTVWRVLEGTMHAGDQVGVTVEPQGGSPQPTSAPIVAIQS